MRNGDEGMRYDVQRQVDDIDKALDTILDETLSIIEYIGTRCE